MRTHVTNLSDRLIDFITGIVNWSWDTVELIFEILVEFLTRAIELTIAILQLSFQIICFLRDVCIEAMQTFVNIFRGIVNVVSSIKCEDVEDFAAACMVVFLWIGAVKITLNLLENHPHQYFLGFRSIYQRKKPFPNPLNFFRAAPCTPVVLEKHRHAEVKLAPKKKVMIQPKKGAGCKRPVSSSISSSSSSSSSSPASSQNNPRR